MKQILYGEAPPPSTGNPGSLFVSRTGLIHNMSIYREHMGRSLGLEIC